MQGDSMEAPCQETSEEQFRSHAGATLHVVLLGGGHANVQVLKQLAQQLKPMDDVRVTLVCDTAVAWYSGMLPGCIAQLYQPSELQIQLDELARWCGIRFIQVYAERIDFHNNTLVCRIDSNSAHRGSNCSSSTEYIRYDILAIDIGSITKGVEEVPGVREYALSTRPISALLSKLEEYERSHPWREWERPPNVVVVGGGAAGVELAFALKARAHAQQAEEINLTIISNSSQLLLERGSWTSGAVLRKLKEKKIAVVLQAQAIRITAESVCLDNGQELEYDLLLWATGAAAPPIFRDSGMETNEEGFLAVKHTLQAKTKGNIFAAGDCCSIEGYEWVPKAGVYAVREGPILAENIMRMVHALRSGDRCADLQAFRPQTSFLSLMMTGDGQAIGSYKGVAYTGSLAWKLKNRIDRAFVRQFDVSQLGPSPAEEPENTLSHTSRAVPVQRFADDTEGDRQVRASNTHETLHSDDRWWKVASS